METSDDFVERLANGILKFQGNGSVYIKLATDAGLQQRVRDVIEHENDLAARKVLEETYELSLKYARKFNQIARVLPEIQKGAEVLINLQDLSS